MKASKPDLFQRIAVLGAGAMGLQLAAHLANARTEVVLFDLATTGPDPDAKLQQKLADLLLLQPPAFALPEYSRAITPATFQNDLARLRDCDLIIETTTEQGDCKEGVLARVAPYINRRAVITTTTDTVSIERLARALPECLRAQFCGLHLLMPPRYTQLVELAASSYTDARVLDQLAHFAVRVLGKQVVRVKDSPLFIADRMAVCLFSLAWRYALRFELTLETVDALLERVFGLSTGVFRTIDRHGANRFVALLEEARAALPQDRWLAQVQWPEVLPAAARLTDKDSDDTAVFFIKQTGQWLSLDPVNGTYRPILQAPLGAFSAVVDAAEWQQLIRQSNALEAQFLRAFLAEFCLYSALHLQQLARSCAEVDLVVRYAYGAQVGIFELWQKLGWETVQDWLPEAAQKRADWPDWVKRETAAYSRKGVYTPDLNGHQPYIFEAAYQRQIPLPALPSGETPGHASSGGGPTSIGFRVWEAEPHTTVLSISEGAALHCAATLQDLQRVLGELFKRSETVVLELQGQPACYDRLSLEPNLNACLREIEALYLQLRYAPVPVVATLNGVIAGPALALALACPVRVCAQNSLLYAGLYAGRCSRSADVYLPAVVGVGHALITYLATAPTPLAQQVQASCMVGMLLQAPLRVGAEAARQQGLLQAQDIVLLNPAELVGNALGQGQQLRHQAYRPPPCWPVPVLGRDSVDSVSSLLADQFPDLHASRLAVKWKMPLIRLLCGGDQPTNSLLSDETLLRLEQKTCQALWHSP